MTPAEMILVGALIMWGGTCYIIFNRQWGDFIHDAFGESMARLQGLGRSKAEKYPAIIVPAATLALAGLALLCAGLVRAVT